MTIAIDLNADLGEGGAHDAELMSVITSCNVACGGHAGDRASMETALRLAREHQVAAGAHPSFPDRANFGRSPSTLSGAALARCLQDQVSELKGMAEALGLLLSHVKPHGALYNMAATDPELALTVAEVTETSAPHAALVGPPNSQLQTMAERLGLDFIAEGFADRAYEPDGQLRSRTLDGAIIHAAEKQVEQALEIATRKTVTAFAGAQIPLPAQTICVHGDTPGAFRAAQSIRRAFEREGIRVCAPN
ncbi:MAG: 5-oxoprolinase subunit PxpA [Pseudomonadota bacterium]